jgi:hypothetical protein
MIKDTVHRCGKEMESRCQDKFGKLRPFRLKRSALSIKNEENYTFCEFCHFK